MAPSVRKSTNHIDVSIPPSRAFICAFQGTVKARSMLSLADILHFKGYHYKNYH